MTDSFSTTRTAAAGAAPLHLEIRGMTCGHCVAAVDRALRGLPGTTVQQVAVGAASVTLGPGVSADDAIAAVRDAGYDARVAEAAPRAAGGSGGSGGSCCSQPA